MARRSIFLLALAAGLALIAVYAVWPTTVGSASAAQATCPPSGIIPGSLEITSSDHEGGQISSQIIRFQLCHTLESSSVASDSGEDAAQPNKIGLLWAKKGFQLDSPGSAGITLQERASGQTWNATIDLSETIYDGYPDYYYGDSYYSNFNGVAVELTPEDLVNLKGVRSASDGAPLFFQFTIPQSVIC